MKKIFSILCLSAMILTFTGCGNSSDSESDSTSKTSTTEQSTEVNIEKSLRSEVTKEGILTRKPEYYNMDGTDKVGYEELYNNDGQLIKITLDEFYAENMPKLLPFPVNAGVTEYEYDGSGNLIKETWNSSAESAVREYDENGLLIGYKHKNAEQSEYDEDKTYSYEKNENGDTVKGYYINNLVDNEGSYVYDEDGNVLSGTFDARHLEFELEYSNGSKTKQIQYGRWAGKTEDTVFSVEEYDSEGRIIHYTAFDENDKIHNEYTEEFDSDGKLEKHNYIVMEDESTDASLEYVYDEEGNCINKLINRSGEVEENAPDRYEYEYDEFGNVIKADWFMHGNDGETTPYYTVYEYFYND